MHEKEREEQPNETEAEAAPGVEPPPTLEQLLEEASQERDQFRSLAQRFQADFLNYKRRVEEEREELQKEANARLILHFLPIMDDFQRALEHAHTQKEDAPWLEGMELIYRKLQGVLELEGVTAIEAMGRDFDPWEHAALFAQETTDHREGEVIGVIQEGYKLHGKVLRPARVVIAKGARGPESPEQGTPDITIEEKEE